MPAVVFVTTLEPKEGRRDELVGLLAELAKHIRGEPGFMQYQEHNSWVRGQIPRISELLAAPPAPPALFEPVPLGGDAAKEPVSAG
jgi:hypothetical protein